jgi:hypothetical protein
MWLAGSLHDEEVSIEEEASIELRKGSPSA